MSDRQKAVADQLFVDAINANREVIEALPPEQHEGVVKWAAAVADQIASWYTEQVGS